MALRANWRRGSWQRPLQGEALRAFGRGHDGACPSKEQAAGPWLQQSSLMESPVQDRPDEQDRGSHGGEDVAEEVGDHSL